jgi:predicted dehydrogenase
MSRTINWGIIGIGRIAEKFASDLATLENTTLLAVASTSLERASEFARVHQVPNAFGSYEEIFSVPDLDVVYIATPHTLHAYCTKLCLEKKVAVLCEKPFAMNESEVREMIDLAKANDTFLMEAMWTRFLPGTLKVLELIQSGAIGDVKTIHADFGFIAPFNPQDRLLNRDFGGGAFLDIGIYPAFLSLLILGYPSGILASGVTGSTGVDETTSFIYTYDDQSTAVLNCTLTAETRTEAFIYGTLGHIHIKPKFHENKFIELVLNDETVQAFDFPRETLGFNYEAAEVNKCLTEGKKESELWPLSQSLKLVHLLDKTREKAGIKYPSDRFY